MQPHSQGGEELTKRAEMRSDSGGGQGAVAGCTCWQVFRFPLISIPHSHTSYGMHGMRRASARIFLLIRTASLLQIQHLPMWGEGLGQACKWCKSRRRLILLFMVSLLVLELRNMYRFAEGGSWGQQRPPCPITARELSMTSREEPTSPDIAIVLVYTKGCLGDDKYIELSVANKRAYADNHGYHLIAITDDDLDLSLQGGWKKLPAVQASLEDHEWVLYIDVDAFIMEGGVRLEGVIRAAQALNGSDPVDFIIGEDHSGVNTGVFLMHNSPFSHKLLADWLDLVPLLMKTNKWGGSTGLKWEYEQRGIHYMLNSEAWQGCPACRKLPKWGGDGAVLLQHMVALPGCAINSIFHYPYETWWKPEKLATAYAPGDFVMHLAGRKTAEVRASIIEAHRSEIFL
ncbi:unnamed protein product [Chrysoparadoxa australica]